MLSAHCPLPQWCQSQQPVQAAVVRASPGTAMALCMVTEQVLCCLHGNCQTATAFVTLLPYIICPLMDPCVHISFQRPEAAGELPAKRKPYIAFYPLQLKTIKSGFIRCVSLKTEAEESLKI